MSASLARDTGALMQASSTYRTSCTRTPVWNREKGTLELALAAVTYSILIPHVLVTPGLLDLLRAHGVPRTGFDGGGGCQGRGGEESGGDSGELHVEDLLIVLGSESMEY